jgi:hypothetical protein
MAEKHQAVLDEIRTTKAVSDAARATMDGAVKAVKAQLQLEAPKDAAKAEPTKAQQPKAEQPKAEQPKAKS